MELIRPNVKEKLKPLSNIMNKNYCFLVKIKYYYVRSIFLFVYTKFRIITLNLNTSTFLEYIQIRVK